MRRASSTLYGLSNTTVGYGEGGREPGQMMPLAVGTFTHMVSLTGEVAAPTCRIGSGIGIRGDCPTWIGILEFPCWRSHRRRSLFCARNPRSDHAGRSFELCALTFGEGAPAPAFTSSDSGTCRSGRCNGNRPQSCDHGYDRGESTRQRPTALPVDAWRKNS